MIGCLSRLVTLGVLAVLGVAGWFTRDAWWPRVRGAVVAEPPPPSVTWSAVDRAAADRARGAVARLSAGGGTAFVNLSAAEFAALYLEPVVSVLADPDARAEAALAGDTVLVRARIALADLGGPQALGPLTGVLEGRQAVQLAGLVEPVSTGLAQFRLTSLAIKELKLPTPALSRVVARIGVRQRTDSVAADAVPLALPAPVADIRVARGRVTLYRGAP